MKYTAKIEKALTVAGKCHNGQSRKVDANLPFLVHPVAVAMIVSEYNDDEDVIAAALLHDTVEDCDYSEEQLLADFGPRIRDIVMGVTETKRDPSGQKLPWQVRKDTYIAGLASDS